MRFLIFLFLTECGKSNLMLFSWSHPVSNSDIIFPEMFQVTRNIELGLAALRGEKGSAYDRIVLNAGMVDHLLGCDGAQDISSALHRAREAVDSGKALNRLLNYIKKSNQVIK